MATSDQKVASAVVWFRRDLRDYDHAALYHALKASKRVYCVFVFDTDILDQLTDKADRRVEFIWEGVRELKAALQEKGGDLIVQHGRASEIVSALAIELGVEAVYANRDYEPAANKRDEEVTNILKPEGIAFRTYKDQVIFERDEILTQAGKPYSVFTPYKNAWLRTLEDFYVRPYPVERYIGHLAQHSADDMPPLEAKGFEHTNLHALKIPTGMAGGNQ